MTGDAPAVRAGHELAALTEALTARSGEDPRAERASLISVAGARSAERAIGVCAAFQMMNRLLDGVGAPVHRKLHPLAKELGFDPADLPS